MSLVLALGPARAHTGPPTPMEDPELPLSLDLHSHPIMLSSAVIGVMVNLIKSILQTGTEVAFPPSPC